MRQFPIPREILVVAALGVAALAAVLATASGYGLSWDEPTYLSAARGVERWLARPLAEMLQPAVIAADWGCEPVNVHPAGLRWLYVAGLKALPLSADPFVRVRAFVLLYFIAAWAAFLLWLAPGRPLAAAAATLALLTLPRAFAHLHFASADVPLAATLLLLTVAVGRGLRTRWFWLAGVALGFAASVKFTGLVLGLVPLAAAAVALRREWRTVLPRLAAILAVALAAFYVLNPDFWHAPLAQWRAFTGSTLTREQWTPIPTLFAGRFYPYRGPWYFPWVIAAITTPLVHLLLLALGLARGAVRTAAVPDAAAPGETPPGPDLRSVLVPAMAAAPLVLLMLPASPTNDGDRYLLPAMPFIAALMAAGATLLWDLLRQWAGRMRWRLAVAVAGAAAGALAVTALGTPLAASYPHGLAYYNEIVGGPAGARRAGFETVYWWEVLNPATVARLNATCAGARVYFPFAPPERYLDFMVSGGRFRFVPAPPAAADFVVVYARPFAAYWEAAAREEAQAAGRELRPLWRVAVDTVTILAVFRCEPVRPAARTAAGR